MFVKANLSDVKRSVNNARSKPGTCAIIDSSATGCDASVRPEEADHETHMDLSWFVCPRIDP